MTVLVTLAAAAAFCALAFLIFRDIDRLRQEAAQDPPPEAGTDDREEDTVRSAAAVSIATVSTTVLLCALALSAPAAAHRLPHRPFSTMSADAKERWLERQVAHARGVVRFIERHDAWKLNATRYPAAYRARDAYRWHTVSLRIASKNLDALRARRVAALTWRGSVDYVQSAFPGSRHWLLACSSSEGGWGRWVPNTQGSGAGGWMQFMAGTFWSHVDQAFAAARTRGLAVPAAARSWYSPLGQAVTAAYMWSRGLSWHWVGARC